MHIRKAHYAAFSLSRKCACYTKHFAALPGPAPDRPDQIEYPDAFLFAVSIRERIAVSQYKHDQRPAQTGRSSGRKNEVFYFPVVTFHTPSRIIAML